MEDQDRFQTDKLVQSLVHLRQGTGATFRRHLLVFLKHLIVLLNHLDERLKKLEEK